jgi:hypothetical protein
VSAPEKEPEVRRLESEVREIRKGLEASVAELDRRRREVMDIRRHKGAALGLVLALGLAAAGAVTIRIRRRRRERSTTRKLRGFRDAVDRMSRHPERIAKEPPPLGPTLLSSAAVAAGTTLAKKIVEKAFSTRG